MDNVMNFEQMFGMEDHAIQDSANVHEEEIDVQGGLQDDFGHHNSLDVPFVPVKSNKKRNPPYLLKEDKKGIKIVTKNLEPVRICLRGAKVCETVVVSLRFTEEKHRLSPVFVRQLHQNGKPEKCNFTVSCQGNEHWHYKEMPLELGHPTASLKLRRSNFDVNENVMFFASFKCFNSCHKENGKKMELVLQLQKLDRTCKETRFELRVCTNVKRDYKEVFPDDEEVSDKRKKSVKHAQPKLLSSTPVPNDVKNRVKTTTIQMVDPAKCKIIESESKKNPVECIPAQSLEKNAPKPYKILLPTVSKERIVVNFIRELGGTAYDMTSIFSSHEVS